MNEMFFIRIYLSKYNDIYTCIIDCTRMVTVCDTTINYPLLGYLIIIIIVVKSLKFKSLRGSQTWNSVNRLFFYTGPKLRFPWLKTSTVRICDMLRQFIYIKWRVLFKKVFSLPKNF